MKVKKNAPHRIKNVCIAGNGSRVVVIHQIFFKYVSQRKSLFKHNMKQKFIKEKSEIIPF